MNGRQYLECQPDAQMLMQMLGLIETPGTPEPVADPSRGGRPRGPSKQGKRPSPVHGTYVMYKAHRCRCEACRAANAAVARDYHARRAGRALAL